MTELEKIERAKMYMDKLANGINPIDDTMAPDDDLINNVRLSRCFFFVSDVLRQVIENGGTKSAVNKKLKKLPLEIPMEKRSQFAYSEVPIPASEIAKRINALADNDTMQKLTYSGILTWLTEIGMMEWALTPDGKRAKRPTKIGEETGISVVYESVPWDDAANKLTVLGTSGQLPDVLTTWAGWLGQFTAAGCFESVDCQISGLGRIADVQQLYIAHTKAAMDLLNG